MNEHPQNPAGGQLPPLPSEPPRVSRAYGAGNRDPLPHLPPSQPENRLASINTALGVVTFLPGPHLDLVLPPGFPVNVVHAAETFADLLCTEYQRGPKTATVPEGGDPLATGYSSGPAELGKARPWDGEPLAAVASPAAVEEDFRAGLEAELQAEARYLRRTLGDTRAKLDSVGEELEAIRGAFAAFVRKLIAQGISHENMARVAREQAEQLARHFGL